MVIGKLGRENLLYWRAVFPCFSKNIGSLPKITFTSAFEFPGPFFFSAFCIWNLVTTKGSSEDNILEQETEQGTSESTSQEVTSLDNLTLSSISEATYTRYGTNLG